MEKKRYVFWIFFAGAAAVYSIWLAAFWPGIMSIDSLKIWRAASLPGVFINDHPVLNMIFYMFLLHIWNNTAVVPSAHIILVSLLVAYVFFMLYRHGVSLVLLIPCYLCVIFSIPVGLYNTLLWKDIPYALLVVFWGITLVRLNIRKREGNARLSRQEILALFLLYLALGLVRHNGLIYIGVVPLYLLLLRPIKKRTVVLVMISSVLIGGLFVAIYHHPPQFLKGQFLYHISHGYLEKLQENPVHKQAARAAGEYLEIFDMEKEGTTSDRFHSYLGDRYAYTFLRIAGFNDVYPYIDPEQPFPALRDTAMNVYEQSYARPWYYVVWNPVFMLAIVPLTIIAFRWLPSTAMYSSFIFIGVITLVFLQVFNWRYYYFYYFGLYFVLPMIFLDMKFLAKQKVNR